LCAELPQYHQNILPQIKIKDYYLKKKKIHKENKAYLKNIFITN